MIAEVVPPEVDALAIQDAEIEGSEMEAQAKVLEILTAEDHEQVCLLERQWSEREKAARTLLDPPVEAAHRAWKANVALRDRIAGAYERARRTAKGKIGAWREEEKARAAEEARRVRDAARRQAEDEALARAQVLQDRGRVAEASALLARPVVAPVVIAAKPAAALGVTSRKAYAAEVYDFPALVAWVAQNPTQRQHYLQPAMPALNRQAVSMKDAMNGEPAPIPGVRATSKFC